MKGCCCIFYTTKGRDRFHWAATPLKPYKVGNICYMTYRYCVLYFLNLSLKHFISHKKGNFCGNIQIRRPLSFRVLTRSRMLNRRTSQSKIEDIVHCKCTSLLNWTTSALLTHAGAKLLNFAQEWNGHWTCRNDPSPFLCVSTGKQRSDLPESSPLCALYWINLLNETTTTLLLRCRTVLNLAKMKWAFNV